MMRLATKSLSIIILASFAPEVGARSEGMAIWSNANRGPPGYGHWDGDGFSFQGTMRDTTEGRWRILQGAYAPTRDEAIVIGVSGDEVVTAQMYSEGEWNDLPFSLDDRAENSWSYGFDVRYESQSGNAVVVWHEGSRDTIMYRTWNGSNWSPSERIDTPVRGGEHSEVNLEASPITNEMVLIVGVISESDYCIVWDGERWHDGIDLQNQGTGNLRNIDVTYEQKSGRAMVIYGDGRTSLPYQIWDGQKWSGKRYVSAPSGIKNRIMHVTIGADPSGSNRIVVGVTSDSDHAFWVGVWDGKNSFGSVKRVASRSSSDDNHGIAVAFEGISGHAIATYAQSSDVVRYQTWSLASGWSDEKSGPDLGAQPISMMLYSNHDSNKIMMAVQNDHGEASFCTWSGSGWGKLNEMTLDAGSGRQPYLFLWKPRSPTLSPTPRPTTSPTVAPTKEPTPMPTVRPTTSPTPLPTAPPTRNPTVTPTGIPTSDPTASPTALPTLSPTQPPSRKPSNVPTPSPTIAPTPGPTSKPTLAPSSNPTHFPSPLPSRSPTPPPTANPTSHPTVSPTRIPSLRPTHQPTMRPTETPTEGPTPIPTFSPTPMPTSKPTTSSTSKPTASPAPTPEPTQSPSKSPTKSPTAAPTDRPTSSPTMTTASPTPSPTTKPSPSPTEMPTSSPTRSPSMAPTSIPEPALKLPPTSIPTDLPDTKAAGVLGPGQVCFDDTDCRSNTCRNGVCMASQDCFPLKHKYGTPFDSNTILIVFVGSAFDRSTHEAWRAQVNTSYQMFGNYSMFSSDIEQLNVFVVDPPKLSRSFCVFDCAGIDRLLCCDLEQAQRLSDKCFPSGSSVQTVVVHNDPRYGGAGYPLQNMATMSTHPQGPLVAIHELGHSLFELTDEYTYGPGTDSDPNCSGDKTCSKWSDLMGRKNTPKPYNKVKCIPGCRNGNYWVGELSYMADLSKPVGAVNERFTCCTYLALTKAIPSYCKVFDKSPDYLLNYCKNNDYQKYGPTNYDSKPKAFIPSEARNSDDKYVFVSDPVSVKIKLHEGGKGNALLDRKPESLSPGLFRKTQVLGDYTSMKKAARNGEHSVVTVRVFYQSGKEILFFSQNATIDIPLLPIGGTGIETNDPRSLSERSNFLEVVLDTKGRTVNKVRPRIEGTK